MYYNTSIVSRKRKEFDLDQFSELNGTLVIKNMNDDCGVAKKEKTCNLVLVVNVKLKDLMKHI